MPAPHSAMSKSHHSRCWRQPRNWPSVEAVGRRTRRKQAASCCKFNQKYGDEQARQRQERVRTIFWSDLVLQGLLAERDLREEQAYPGDLLDVYLRALGMPRPLKSMGSRRSNSTPWLRTACGMLALSKGGKEEVFEILEMAWDDWGVTTDSKSKRCSSSSEATQISQDDVCLALIRRTSTNYSLRVCISACCRRIKGG